MSLAALGLALAGTFVAGPGHARAVRPREIGYRPMDAEFWLERWDRQQTGFHQRSVNAQLRRFWPRVGVTAGDTVFVPLCGKSGDMTWLRAQGHPVVGVELSPVAVEAYFSENGLVPERRRAGKFDVAEAAGVRIYCGDLFDLTAEELEGVRAVYDRAALVALPPAMREGYAAHMVETLPPGTAMLLVTLEYPQEELQGPPFSVSPAEVERLFGPRGEVRLLERESILAREPGFAERGVTALDECAFLVRFPG